MRIKILHVLDSLSVGGLENGVVNLMNHSNPEKFAHSICCLRQAGSMSERIKVPDIDIFSMGKSSKDYLIALKLAKLIRRYRPDIVHARNWGTIEAIIAARLAGAKIVIYSEHGREASDLYGSSRKRNRIRRLLLRQASHIVSVSDDIRNWLVRDVGLPSGRITTIRNGVDVCRFCPPSDKSAAKSNLGFAPDVLLLGAVGRLDPVKNYPMLLRSVYLLKEDAKAFKLVLIGDGPQQAELEQVARNLDLTNVEFLGYRPGIDRYLQAFDLFVQTSLAEGISNSILEAMSSGLPVLATLVGGNIEIVKDGVTGSLVASGDEIGLSKLLRDYLADSQLREKTGRAARTYCLEHFSIETMVSAYESLYASLAGQRDIAGGNRSN